MEKKTSRKEGSSKGGDGGAFFDGFLCDRGGVSKETKTIL
jgi:hypothetical protein